MQIHIPATITSDTTTTTTTTTTTITTTNSATKRNWQRFLLCKKLLPVTGVDSGALRHDRGATRSETSRPESRSSLPSDLPLDPLPY